MPTSLPSPPRVEVHGVEFTGSGFGYLRVAAVNLVLMLLTLGLYRPWARRRAIRWFCNHTQIAGSPLDFVPPMRPMVFGLMLAGACYAAYHVAGQLGQQAAVTVMLVAGAALTPAVWAGALRFRLSSTRWRGVHGRFAAGWGEIYRASWPVFAIAAVWSVMFAALGSALVMGIGLLTTSGPRAAMALLGTTATTLAAACLLALVATVVLHARLDYNYTRLMFERAGVGDETGRFKVAFVDFLWTGLGGVGLGVAIALALSVVLGVIVSLPYALLVGLGAGYLVGNAWRHARRYAMVWNAVGLARLVRTRCTLSPWRFVGLRLLNAVLTLLTVGLYWPFAAIAEHRMKVESIELHTRGDLDGIVGRLKPPRGAVADAMADAAGFEFAA